MERWSIFNSSQNIYYQCEEDGMVLSSNFNFKNVYIDAATSMYTKGINL